jgi:hypothetical protein
MKKVRMPSRAEIFMALSPLAALAEYYDNDEQEGIIAVHITADDGSNKTIRLTGRNAHVAKAVLTKIKKAGIMRIGPKV